MREPVQAKFLGRIVKREGLGCGTIDYAGTAAHRHGASAFLYMRGKASLYWELIMKPTKRFPMITSALHKFIPRFVRSVPGRSPERDVLRIL